MLWKVMEDQTRHIYPRVTCRVGASRKIAARSRTGVPTTMLRISSPTYPTKHSTEATFGEGTVQDQKQRSNSQSLAAPRAI
mmetsp:Transcript_30812/g.66318  ORF Transcript_30812/g.66318 Transcript_30812/m.66318 type:complete len:81 (+) Transcript_30812:75-317(+)